MTNTLTLALFYSSASHDNKMHHNKTMMQLNGIQPSLFLLFKLWHFKMSSVKKAFSLMYRSFYPLTHNRRNIVHFVKSCIILAHLERVQCLKDLTMYDFGGSSLAALSGSRKKKILWKTVQRLFFSSKHLLL